MPPQVIDGLTRLLTGSFAWFILGEYHGREPLAEPACRRTPLRSEGMANCHPTGGDSLLTTLWTVINISNP